jgi:hypothetical protein
MSEVALDDVDGGAGVEQGGGLGVPEPVAAGVRQFPAVAVTQPDRVAELAEHQVVVAGFPGAGGLAVAGQPGEQVTGGPVRAEVPPLPDPFLLLADDLHDVGADQDGHRGALDLGLLVAEPGNHPAVGNGGRVDAGNRGQRVEVHQQHFGSAPPGQRLDQPGPHRGGLTEPGDVEIAAVAGDGHRLVPGHAEQLDAGEHLRQVGVADVVALVGFLDHALGEEFAGPVEPGVRVGELQPPVITGRRGGVGLVVVHGAVEVPDDPLGAGNRPVIQRPAAFLLPVGAAPPLPQERPEIQHQRAQSGRVCGQGRMIEPAGDGEFAEPCGEHVPGRGRGPGQLPRFELQVHPEGVAVAQPAGPDVVPADRGFAAGLMFPAPGHTSRSPAQGVGPQAADRRAPQ